MFIFQPPLKKHYTLYALNTTFPAKKTSPDRARLTNVMTHGTKLMNERKNALCPQGLKGVKPKT